MCGARVCPSAARTSSALAMASAFPIPGKWWHGWSGSLYLFLLQSLYNSSFAGFASDLAFWTGSSLSVSYNQEQVVPPASVFLASLSLKSAWIIPPTFFMGLGVSRPTGDSVLSVFQGSVNKRMSTPRRKGHLLPSGDLDLTWEPGRWPRASLLPEVWVRSQNSSLRAGLGPCPQGWLGHAAGPKAPCVHLKSETLPEKWKAESGSRKNSGPGTWVKRVWLYALSCETVTNIIWQEIRTCMTVSPNRCLT